MSQLARASGNRAIGQMPTAHIAHDLRNLLATIALHVETLGRLAGSPGAKAASAAYALTAKAATVCNSVIDGAGLRQPHPPAQR
jgi:signal transduction histidine kinase